MPRRRTAAERERRRKGQYLPHLNEKEIRVLQSTTGNPPLITPPDVTWELYICKDNNYDRMIIKKSNFQVKPTLSSKVARTMYYLEFDESHTFNTKHRQARFWFMYCQTLIQFDMPMTRLERAYYDGIVEKKQSSTSFAKRDTFIVLYLSLKEELYIVRSNEAKRYAERMNQRRMRDQDTGRVTCDENHKDIYQEVVAVQKKAAVPTKNQVKGWKKHRAALTARLSIVDHLVGPAEYATKISDEKDLVDSFFNAMTDVIAFGHDVKEELTGHQSSVHSCAFWKPLNQQVRDLIMEKGDILMEDAAPLDQLPQFSSAQESMDTSSGTDHAASSSDTPALDFSAAPAFPFRSFKLPSVHAPRQAPGEGATPSALSRTVPLKPSTSTARPPQAFTVLTPSSSPPQPTALQHSTPSQQSPASQQAPLPRFASQTSLSRSGNGGTTGVSNQPKTPAQSRAVPGPPTANRTQAFTSLPYLTTLPGLSTLQQPSVHQPSVHQPSISSQPSTSATARGPSSIRSTSGKPNSQRTSGPSLPHITKLFLAKAKQAKEQKP